MFADARFSIQYLRGDNNNNNNKIYARTTDRPTRIVNDVNMKIFLAVNLANKRIGCCRVGSMLYICTRTRTTRRFCDKVISII